jgi:transcriptional regulator with XRE-family HTH domain
MAKKENRIYSRYNKIALELLSKRIKYARKDKGMTTQELAERVGISRDMLYRIEKGDPSCAIGVVFEVVTTLGLELFNSNSDELNKNLSILDRNLALLPMSVRTKKVVIDDDF